MDAVRIVSLVLLSTGIIASLGFLVRYMTKFRWYSTSIGRHLVAMSSVVCAFYLWYLIIWIWPDLPSRSYVRTGLFVLLTFILVWRWIMFECVIKKGKTDK